MAVNLPPFKGNFGSPQWVRWLEEAYRKITSLSAISWAQVDKTGSSLADLATRTHAMLQSILGWSSGTDTTQNKHISQADGRKWDEGANQAVLSLMTSPQSDSHADLSASLHMIPQTVAETVTDLSAVVFTESKQTTTAEDISGLYWMGG